MNHLTTNNEPRATKYEQQATSNKQLIMQYKPNFLDAQMNISSVITKDYENEPPLRTPEKQTQSNPIANAKNAAAIDSDMSSATGDYATLINALSVLDAPGLNNALEQINHMPHAAAVESNGRKKRLYHLASVLTCLVSNRRMAPDPKGPCEVQRRDYNGGNEARTTFRPRVSSNPRNERPTKVGAS